MSTEGTGRLSFTRLSVEGIESVTQDQQGVGQQHPRPRTVHDPAFLFPLSMYPFAHVHGPFFLGSIINTIESNNASRGMSHNRVCTTEVGSFPLTI
jgi:hypothetical protein